MASYASSITKSSEHKVSEDVCGNGRGTNAFSGRSFWVYFLADGHGIRDTDGRVVALMVIEKLLPKFVEAVSLASQWPPTLAMFIALITAFDAEVGKNRGLDSIGSTLAASIVCETSGSYWLIHLNVGDSRTIVLDGTGKPVFTSRDQSAQGCADLAWEASRSGGAIVDKNLHKLPQKDMDAIRKAAETDTILPNSYSRVRLQDPVSKRSIEMFSSLGDHELKRTQLLTLRVDTHQMVLPPGWTVVQASDGFLEPGTGQKAPNTISKEIGKLVKKARATGGVEDVKARLERNFKDRIGGANIVKEDDASFQVFFE